MALADPSSRRIKSVADTHPPCLGRSSPAPTLGDRQSSFGSPRSTNKDLNPLRPSLSSTSSLPPISSASAHARPSLDIPLTPSLRMHNAPSPRSSDSTPSSPPSDLSRSPLRASSSQTSRLPNRTAPSPSWTPFLRRLPFVPSTRPSPSRTPSSPGTNRSSIIGIDIEWRGRREPSSDSSSGDSPCSTPFEFDSDRASISSSWSDHFKDQDTRRLGVERFVVREKGEALGLGGPISLGSPPGRANKIVDLDDDSVGAIEEWKQSTSSSRRRSSAASFDPDADGRSPGGGSMGLDRRRLSTYSHLDRPLSPSPSLSPSRMSFSFGTRTGPVTVRPWSPPLGSPVSFLSGLPVDEPASPTQIRLRRPSSMSCRTMDSILSFPWSLPSSDSSGSALSPLPIPTTNALGLSASVPSKITSAESSSSDSDSQSPPEAAIDGQTTTAIPSDRDGRVALPPPSTPDRPVIDISCILFPDSPPSAHPDTIPATADVDAASSISLPSTSSHSLLLSPTSTSSRQSVRGRIPQRRESLDQGSIVLEGGAHAIGSDLPGQAERIKKVGWASGDGRGIAAREKIRREEAKKKEEKEGKKRRWVF